MIADHTCTCTIFKTVLVGTCIVAACEGVHMWNVSFDEMTSIVTNVMMMNYSALVSGVGGQISVHSYSYRQLYVSSYVVMHLSMAFDTLPCIL